MTEHLSALYDRVTKPISDEAPCGENAKYDERFDKIKSEVMKLTAGSVGMDWNAILINADELLTEKTKDLTLAAYLMLGLVKINGYPGLAVGLKVLIYFIDEYWEAMFPPVKRQRARIQIFEWINERIPTILSVVEVKPEDADAVRECMALVQELPEKAQNVIRSQPFSFGALRAEVTARMEALPAPTPPPPSADNTVGAKDENGADATSESESQKTAEGEQQAGTPAAPVPQATASPAMAPIATTTEIGSIKEGLSAIVKVIQLIREAQPDAPVAYRLGRVAKWGAIESIPPSGPDGKTKIPPPRDQEIQIFETQLNAKNWKTLRESAENAFLTSGPWLFNLNLQRYVFWSLQGTGAGEAAEVIQFETGHFLQRFPQLLDLSYNSGLAFADGATRAWCDEAIQLTTSGGGNGDDSEDNSWQDEAKSIAQSKNVVAALEIVQNSIKQATSKKDALKRQLFAAKLCITHNNLHWAVPMLESLNTQISEINFAEWEPEFCSEVWDNLLKGYNALQPTNKEDKEELKRRMQIRQRLYDVDLVRAVSVTPKK